MHSVSWRGVEPHWREAVVVGAGTSAVEVAEDCARAGVMTHMWTRKGKVKTLPKAVFGQDLHHFLGPLESLPRLAFMQYCKRQPTVLGTDQGFERFVKEGRIRIHGPGLWHGRTVRFDDTDSFEPDVVVCATGYEYRCDYLPQDIARWPHLPKTTVHGESTSHKGLYLLGMPCARGVDSEYLRGIAKDAPRIARPVRGR